MTKIAREKTRPLAGRVFRVKENVESVANFTI